MCVIFVFTLYFPSVLLDFRNSKVNILMINDPSKTNEHFICTCRKMSLQYLVLVSGWWYNFVVYLSSVYVLYQYCFDLHSELSLSWWRKGQAAMSVTSAFLTILAWPAALLPITTDFIECTNVIAIYVLTSISTLYRTSGWWGEKRSDYLFKSGLECFNRFFYGQCQ